MRYLIAACMLLICCQPSGRQSLSKAKKDSVVRRMNSRFNQFFISGNDDSTNYYIRQYADTVHALHYDRLYLHWTLARAQQIAYYENYDSLRVLLDSAVILSRRADITQKDLLNFYIIYNGMLSSLGEKDSALHMAHEANFLARQIDTNRLAQTNTDLAAIYEMLKDMPNLRKYAIEAAKHVKNEPDLKRYSALNLMHYYEEVGMMDSVRYYYNSFAGDTFWATRPRSRAEDLQAMAVILFNNGKKKEGTEMFLQAKAIWDFLHLTNTLTYLNLSEIYSETRQYKKALLYADSAMIHGQNKQDYNWIRLSWQGKAAVYRAMSDSKMEASALDSAMAAFVIEQDSSLVKYGREMESKYAGREKDVKIESLAFANKISQQVQRQQRIIIGVMIVAVLALVLSAVMFWRRRKLRQQLRESSLQQKVLQSLMQPHFVINILTVLKGLIRSGDQDKSIAFLTQFGRVTEQNLLNAQAPLVTLREELTAIENYLTFQKMQLSHAFDYEIRLSPDLEEDEIYILPMLVQPFVENAVIHGFRGINYSGIIRLRIEREGRLLKIIVDDNGRGMLSAPSRDRKRIHATEIAMQRLALLRRSTGNDRAGIAIKDKKQVDGQGVEVILLIPWQYQVGG